MSRHSFGVALVVLALAVFLASCGPSVPEVTPRRAAAIVDASRSVLATMGETEVLLRSEWPDTLAELEPEEIRRLGRGLFIRTWSSFVQERGYWVPAEGTSADTFAGRDPQYLRIADDLYWCRIEG